MTGEDRSGDIHCPEHRSLDLRAEIVRRDLLGEPSVKIARVIDEHIDTAKPVDGGTRGGLGIVGTGDVKPERQEVVVGPERGADPLRVASGANYRWPILA